MANSDSLCACCENNHKTSSLNEIKKPNSFVRILCFALTICMLSITFSTSMTNIKCLISTPHIMEEIFRPPANCHMCSDLKEIPRLNDVDPVEFMNRFAYSGIPAVIEDCTDNWAAKKFFDVNFFWKLYSLKNDSECQFFRYKTNFTSLQQALTIVSGEMNDVWYIGWSNCDGEISDLLRQHYSTPYFLPAHSEPASTDWIFMGTSGYGAHKHIDNVKYPSWQAQIRGSKKWILYPPPECYYVCNQEYYEIILKPGDTIVVDTNVWYHETHVISNEISISIGSEFD